MRAELRGVLKSLDQLSAKNSSWLEKEKKKEHAAALRAAESLSLGASSGNVFRTPVQAGLQGEVIFFLSLKSSQF